jgi:hypothetical protein
MFIDLFCNPEEQRPKARLIKENDTRIHVYNVVLDSDSTSAGRIVDPNIIIFDAVKFHSSKFKITLTNLLDELRRKPSMCIKTESSVIVTNEL